MTVEEAYNQMQKRMKPVPPTCINCFKMPACWLNEEDFNPDAVKSCYEPRQIPHYIKNLEIK